MKFFRRIKQQPCFVTLFLIAVIIQIIEFICLLPNLPSSSSSSSHLAFPSLLKASDTPILDFNSPLNLHNESFSACLLTMDDSAIGLLQEWIAFHYTKLPLRRLIVANDPRSSTSPSTLLNKWKDLIEITEWTDKDYFSVMWRSAIMNREFNSTADRLTYLHRFRQRFFYFKCMKQLKRENKTFVALIDSDEFLNFPNPNWKYHSIIEQQQQKEQYDRQWTVIEFLHRLRHYKQTSVPCISLPRLLFGAKERTYENKYNNPSLLKSIDKNASDFVTIEFTFHGELNDHKLNKAGKALVDVSRIPSTSFVVEQTDVHRPVRDYCGEKEVWTANIDSLLVLQHYIGTFEQWSFRSDPRLSRTKDRFDFYKTIDTFSDHSIEDWLEDFVNKVGSHRAKDFLEGVGKVTSRNVSAAGLSEKIYSNLIQSNVSAANVKIVNET